MATFNTPYDRDDPRNGQEVEVVAQRMVPFFTQLDGRSAQKQYTVRFPDGFEDNVWPEEIGEEES
jgi:hypothetical protein